MKNKMSPKPGWRSRLAVWILLGEALLEGIKLPFRLAAYLINRKAIAGEMRRVLGNKDAN